MVSNVWTYLKSIPKELQYSRADVFKKWFEHGRDAEGWPRWRW
jgi:hypothetical protein